MEPEGKRLWKKAVWGWTPHDRRNWELASLVFAWDSQRQRQRSPAHSVPCTPGMGQRKMGLAAGAEGSGGLAPSPGL